MKTLNVLAACAACLAFTAGSSPAAELQLPRDLPPYGADRPVPVPQIEKHTLPNGMLLWIVADDEGMPKANFVLATRGGKAHDSRSLNGLSEIMAGTMDEGTKSRCRLVTMMTKRSSHMPTLTNMATIQTPTEEVRIRLIHRVWMASTLHRISIHQDQRMGPSMRFITMKLSYWLPL